MKVAPNWTWELNLKLTTQYATIYTLYFQGLVRGHMIGAATAQAIALALNEADVTVPLKVGRP